MNNNIEQINKLNDLVTTSFKRKHIIVLNPETKLENKDELDTNIIYDKIAWKIPDKIQPYINELSKNPQLSNEDKILSIYETLCREYIYDDNVLSYIQKVDDDLYTLPDWYGRDIGQEWEENREQHNRRVCYEVSRYLAKSLAELFKDNNDMNICILWDKGLTHYFVGLTSDEYSLTLDLDNFNDIKDMTRIKAGLTADGINILDDKEGIFKNKLDNFNENRCKNAVNKIKDDISNNENAPQDKEKSNPNEESESIIFLRNAIEILKNKHNIDSQGIYEYMKEIVDITLGPELRKKVWKEIKPHGDNEQTRYIRCLILNIENQQYIIDVDEMSLCPFNEEEFKKEDREFIPYKELLSEELINYRSRKEERYNGR